jgi:hypothetical protein
MTTGFPNQEEYTGEKSLGSSVIILDALPFGRPPIWTPSQLFGIDFTRCTGTCSVTEMESLFKSEQSLETQITPEIEDDETATGVARVHGK